MASESHALQPPSHGRWHSVARGFSSLSNPNYRLYWFGQLVSLTGTWMQRLAQDWLVLRLTNSPFALGLVSMLQFLPITLFSLYGGVIADRFPKRQLLLVTQTVATVQAIAMATLASLGIVNLWEIYVLAVILGLSNAFDQPARQSFPVELVGRSDVANAVALNATLFNTSRIVGPSLAGIAIATIGIAGCFWLNAVSFAGTIGSLLLMNPQRFFAVPPRQRGSFRELVTGGINYALNTPAVLVLLIGMLFLGTFGFNFTTFLPLLARFALHTNSLGYGFLFAGLGAGSLLAALVLAYTRLHSLRTIFVGGTCFVVALALLGLSHIYVASLALLILVGVCSVAYSTSTQARLQVIVPDHFRGRVMSLYTLMFAGSVPIGSLFIGAVSERWSVEVAIEICCALSAVGLLLAALYQFRRRRVERLLPARVQERGDAGFSAL
jgi:MFS family permease